MSSVRPLPHFSRRLDSLTDGKVRGKGSMIGVELVKDKVSKGPVRAMRNRIEDLAFERGLIVRGCGESSLRICSPLIIREEKAAVRWIFWKGFNAGQSGIPDGQLNVGKQFRGGRSN